MVGPFVCRTADLTAVAERVDESDEFDVAVLAGDDVRGALQALDETPRLRLAAVELSNLGRELTTAAPVYVEIPVADVDKARLTRLGHAGLRVKLRTGGTSSSAFPGENQLAAAIKDAVEVGVPFKCTAGLHHAVRHTDPRSGFEHHGFLNVLLAVSACLDGDDPEPTLRCRDGAALSAQGRRIGAERVTAIRSSFVSFGTCSIDEPIADLVHLGLVTAQ
jgi:hypothetical protein